MSSGMQPSCNSPPQKKLKTNDGVIPSLISDTAGGAAPQGSVRAACFHQEAGHMQVEHQKENLDAAANVDQDVTTTGYIHIYATYIHIHIHYT